MQASIIRNKHILLYANWMPSVPLDFFESPSIFNSHRISNLSHKITSASDSTALQLNYSEYTSGNSGQRLALTESFSMGFITSNVSHQSHCSLKCNILTKAWMWPSPFCGVEIEVLFCTLFVPFSADSMHNRAVWLDIMHSMHMSVEKPGAQDYVWY
jgi:hypothetical protein